MSHRLLLDENVEHEVQYRLRHYGYDVAHVDFEPTLGKGASDESLADFSRDQERLIVTDDDDFVLDIDEDAFHGVLYLPDASAPAADVADMVHAMLEVHPQEELAGLQFVGADWL